MAFVGLRAVVASVAAAGPTRHVYEELFVSSCAARLLSRTLLLSNEGGVPEDVVQFCVGPGNAFVYQVAKSAVGGLSTIGLVLTPTT